MKQLRSFDDVVRVYGGPTVVGELTYNTAAAVCNWKKKRGRFPAKFYDDMIKDLERRGYCAPAKLWGQVKLNRVSAQQQRAA